MRAPETDGDLERAAGMVKDVLYWETPGKSYTTVLSLSSNVGCWEEKGWKKPKQLGVKPELQNMPPLATEYLCAAWKQAHEVIH